MATEIGTKLGRYEIRSKIGAGGRGEVYLAEDTRLHRKVALKILPAGSELLYGPALREASLNDPDEPATAILHSTAAPGEAATRAQIQMTDQTEQCCDRHRRINASFRFKLAHWFEHG